MADNVLDQKTIEKTFRELGIPVSIPYNGATEFSRNFEKCSVYRDTPIFYSANTAAYAR